MKQIVRYGFFLLGRIWSFIYSLNLSKKIGIAQDLLYTAWLSRSFKTFGSRSLIARSCTLLGGKYVSIGNHVVVGKNAVITAWDKYEKQCFQPDIRIGDNTSIGEYAHISAINKIIIGQNVLTGRWLTIVDNAHGRSDVEMLEIPPVKRPLHIKGPVIVGDNVWIGDKVTITSGVVVGKNSIIGANTVVTKDIPECSIVAGISAKVVKTIK